LTDAVGYTVLDHFNSYRIIGLLRQLGEHDNSFPEMLNEKKLSGSSSASKLATAGGVLWDAIDIL
jgi:hypothetical protein